MQKTMLKYKLLLFFMLIASVSTFAQTGNNVYEKFLDFNLARFENNPQALALGEALLDSAFTLKPKVQVSFYNGLAKLYEDSAKPEKALIYYDKVARAEPNYYVAQRALGYLYFKKANEVGVRLNNSKGNKALNDKLAAEYKVAVKKAIPYLEKAQACDPSDETLNIIKTLYKNIGDQSAISTLDARLSALSKNCIDILTEQ